MSALAHVEFHGDTLWAVREDDGRVLVAVKPIAVAMGLGWNGQLERLKGDPVLSRGMQTICIPSAQGRQETVCLPLELVNGWLFKIDARRVKPEAREKVIAYQRECYAVLFAHFHGKAVSAAHGTAANDEPALPDPADQVPDLDVWRMWLLLITTARKVYGPEAARAIWAQSPLPQVNMIAGAVADEIDLASDVGAFVRGHLAEDPLARTPNATVLDAWNAAHPRRMMTAPAFGRLLKAAGFKTGPARYPGRAMARSLFGWTMGKAA